MCEFGNNWSDITVDTVFTFYLPADFLYVNVVRFNLDQALELKYCKTYVEMILSTIKDEPTNSGTTIIKLCGTFK